MNASDQLKKELTRELTKLERARELLSAKMKDVETQMDEAKGALKALSRLEADPSEIKIF